MRVWWNDIKHNDSPFVVVEKDRIRNDEIENIELRSFVFLISDNKTERLPGYLPIVNDMPVLITHNIATELHISNGSIDRLVRLVSDNDESDDTNNYISDPKFPTNTVYIWKPLYTLAELSQSRLASPLLHLQPTIISIMPEQKTIKINLKSFITSSQKRLLNNRTSITIYRTQLPIVPVYA